MSTPHKIREWRIRNVEHVKAYEAIYRQSPEFKIKKAERDKRWREANREKKRLTDKAWRKENPEKYAAQQSRWRKKHPDMTRAISAKRRAQKREGLVRFGRIDEELIDNYQSRICGICKLMIKGRYEVDHIIPLSKNGAHVLENLQLTHPICNRTKGGRLQKDIILDIVIIREYLK